MVGKERQRKIIRRYETTGFVCFGVLSSCRYERCIVPAVSRKALHFDFPIGKQCRAHMSSDNCMRGINVQHQDEFIQVIRCIRGEYEGLADDAVVTDSVGMTARQAHQQLPYGSTIRGVGRGKGIVVPPWLASRFGSAGPSKIGTYRVVCDGDDIQVVEKYVSQRGEEGKWMKVVPACEERWVDTVIKYMPPEFLRSGKSTPKAR